MDKTCNDIYHQVNEMHLKLSSKLEDLLSEQRRCKSVSEDLYQKLESSSDEILKLKKQNNILRVRNEELKSTIYKCISLIQKTDFTKRNLTNDYTSVLDALKKYSSDESLCRGIPLGLMDNHVADGFKRSHFSAVRKLYEEDVGAGEKCLPKNKSKSEGENADCTSMLEADLTSPRMEFPHAYQKGVSSDTSPVFKSMKYRRQGDIHFKPPSKFMSSSFFNKTMDAFGTPVKRKPMEFTIATSSKSPLESPSPKRLKEKLKFFPSKRSPQLKKSNSREVVMTDSGSRKLTQTKLNPDVFKKKSQDSDVHEMKVESPEPVEETKPAVQEWEDEIIWESPKKKQSLPDIGLEKSEGGLPMSKSADQAEIPVTGVQDLDETFVPLTVVENCKLTDENSKSVDGETDLSNKMQEKSPEYDSIPFLYQRGAVRKKSERMQLPGQMCVDCNKYYNDVFGDETNVEELKGLVKKCSRHRALNSPGAEDTPPGFWKPFLTGTINCPTEKETIKDDSVDL